MKKAFYFVGSFLTVIGGIGSFDYLVWEKEWGIAAGVVFLCIAAFPTVKGWIKNLING